MIVPRGVTLLNCTLLIIHLNSKYTSPSFFPFHCYYPIEIQFSQSFLVDSELQQNASCAAEVLILKQLPCVTIPSR